MLSGDEFTKKSQTRAEAVKAIRKYHTQSQMKNDQADITPVINQTATRVVAKWLPELQAPKDRKITHFLHTNSVCQPISMAQVD